MRDRHDATANAGAFEPEMLAAIGPELAYNDPQVGVEAGAEGRLQDRNIELLLPDSSSLTQTPAVMFIAETSTRPSWTSEVAR